MKIPDDRYYSEHHLWVKKDGHKLVIGITEYAAKELGEVDFIEIPEPDDTITNPEAFGSLETSKAVTDLIAPVSGTVMETNEPLIDEPGALTHDPYNSGWVIAVKYESEEQIESLMNSDQYEKLLDGLEEE